MAVQKRAKAAQARKIAEEKKANRKAIRDTKAKGMMATTGKGKGKKPLLAKKGKR